MTKEAKLGLFAILVLAASIWGYKFLKGKNLLSKSYTFEAVYNNVDQLTVSSPVLLNGLAIGSVTSIKINENNLKEMIVTFDIEKDYKIPKDAIAYQVSNGIINGKAISIKYDISCTGANCAESGDRLEGRLLGFIGSLVGKEEVGDYLNEVTSGLTEVVNKLGSEDGKGAVNEAIIQLNKTLKNLESLTRTSDALLKNSYSGLTETMNNMGKITSNLAKNNDQITGLLANLNTITADIKNAKLSNVSQTATETLSETKIAVQQLQSTLKNTDGMVSSLEGVMKKVNNGSGSIGQLVNNETLYKNLEETSKNLSLLLQDLRLNPKRYVNVSVFGKKDKAYTLPENDPAHQDK